MKKLRLYYSVVDYYPPYRVDVADLFGRNIASKDAEIEWFMANSQVCNTSVSYFEGQKVNLPFLLNGKSIYSKLCNKLFYWVCDLTCLIKCLTKSINVIQVRDKYLAAIMGLLIARIKGVKFIYWCSYPFPEHDIQNARLERGIKRYFHLIRGALGKLVLYRLVMPFSHHVFVQSEQMKRDISAYGVLESKLTPVSMGVSKKLLDWSSDNQFEIISGRIVYLGTLAKVRRLHILIDAFSMVLEKFPSASLFIVGDGDSPDERLALESQVQTLGLSKSVTFTGFVPMEEAWKITASASVCVSPFYPTPVLNSCSPTKLCEYMALSRPVVCNDHPEQSLILKESGAGICINWSSQGFADSIIWLLNHPDQAELMGKNGRQWIEANRTYPIISEGVWLKYQEILRVD